MTKINIVYQVGFFGSQLRFICEKFSKLTPELTLDPFDHRGRTNNIPETSWSDHSSWSGLFRKYHHEFLNDLDKNKNIPICLIMPTQEQGWLLAKTLTLHRNNNAPADIDTVWKLPRKKLNPLLHEIHDNLCTFYAITKKDIVLPRSMVRDWFKLEWVDNHLSQSYDVQYYKQLMDRDSLRSQHPTIFPLEAFLDVDHFMSCLSNIDSEFDLNIDFDRSDEIQDFFNKSLSMDNERGRLKRCLDICDALANNNDMKINDLSVIHESYIAAYLEKNNKNFIFPLRDDFFQSTAEINLFVKHFPEYYKMPNPHLRGKTQ